MVDLEMLQLQALGPRRAIISTVTGIEKEPAMDVLKPLPMALE